LTITADTNVLVRALVATPLFCEPISARISELFSAPISEPRAA
jgi:hypothetical protein